MEIHAHDGSLDAFPLDLENVTSPARFLYVLVGVVRVSRLSSIRYSRHEQRHSAHLHVNACLPMSLLHVLAITG